MFDELGVQAYLGAALSLYQDKELLTAAASIFGVEARRAAILGVLENMPAEDGVYQGALETTPSPPTHPHREVNSDAHNGLMVRQPPRGRSTARTCWPWPRDASLDAWLLPLQSSMTPAPTVAVAFGNAYAPIWWPG